MSSGSHRDRGFRGGRGGFRGGRSGFNHRRYWDNDDYDKRKGRGRSRSRSRSDSRSSRSYSRSRSKSHSRTPDSSKKAEVYQPKPVTMDAVAPTSISSTAQSENYAPSALNANAIAELYGQLPPPVVSQNGQQYGMQEIKYPLGYAGASAATMNAYGFGFDDQFQGVKPSAATVPLPAVISTETSKKKKKKDGKKKKKRRRRSSSSSSASSSSSNDSSERRKKRKTKKKNRSKDTEESSDSSESGSKQAPTGGDGGVGLPTPQQREQLEKQKEGYKSKLLLLETELNRLKVKAHELKKEKVDKEKIEENLKLQAEVKGRCKAVNIVLEKIDDVLASGTRPVGSVPQAVAVQHAVRVPTTTDEPVKLEGKTLNLDFYDAGQYWCRLCNVFPETLAGMLDHFHGKEHHIQIEQLGIEEKPWHKRGIKETKPEPGAKRIPFRGIQFFSPIQGWYCRLCSQWMGDHHCAIEHLKSVEHNSNFMNFVEEHPEWEGKWLVDREHSRKKAGLEDKPRKSRFDSAEAIARSGETKDDNTRSIHVQMRNMPVKEEEAPQNFVAINANKQDKTVDEWMGKPATAKLNLDIDTQKFAAIVREKHGSQKEKEKEKEVIKVSPAKAEKAQSHSRESRERDRPVDRDRRDNRRSDARVELSFAGRRDDRDRNRDTRGRRRSRSRSRSREREREHRRSSRDRDRRDRSRSRDRDRRRDQDRRREKDKVDSKEPAKKLPLIGKMPLYKKPTAPAGKEKETEPEANAGSTAVSDSGTGAAAIPGPGQSKYETNSITYDPMEVYNNASMEQVQPDQAVPTTGYDTTFGLQHDTTVTTEASYGASSMTISSTTGASAYMYDKSAYTNAFQPAPAVYDDLKPPGEKETPLTGTGGTALPDDLQQALDLIYAGSSVKPSLGSGIPFPPPGVPPVDPAAASQYDSEYGSYNYGEYEQQQDSFEGYAPMFDEEEAPPGIDVPSASSQYTQPVTATPTENITNQEGEADDADDLRMLGIDIEDAAAALVKK